MLQEGRYFKPSTCILHNKRITDEDTSKQTEEIIQNLALVRY